MERGGRVVLINNEPLGGLSQRPPPSTNAPRILDSPATHTTPSTITLISSASPESTEIPNYFKRLWYRLHKVLRAGRRSTYDLPVDICIDVSGEEVKRYGLALIDTQCWKNLISTDQLSNYPGLDFERCIESVGFDIQGHEIFSIGKLPVRWYHYKSKRSLFGSPIRKQTRYERSICYVIESSVFDLVIGRETIEKLEQIGRPIFAFRPAGPRIDSNIQQTQQTANIVRENAKEAKRRREEEIRVKQELEKAQREKQIKAKKEEQET
ncbi:hypothetical protein GQ44DRAFT_40334 [Phaeosphaeriaceae sp. PMI808]|nr:hypothetical protein GQ44DRAFT_40334 [Phaeosphaeriaceae sp. PMI808]